MGHWNLVLPPSRPSAEQLSVFADALTETDRFKPAAVLGATPEYRDLLFELGFEQVYLFDANPGFVEEMTRLRVYRSAETLVEGDWLRTLPDFAGRFSVILSDLTSGNIPYELRTPFYMAVGQALSPEGLFCDKVLTHPIPHIDSMELAKKYEHVPVNLLYANRFSCEMLFCSDFLSEADLVDTERFYARLEREFPHPRIRAFAKLAEYITPRGMVWYYGRRWDLLASDYALGLDLVREDNDEPLSPYAGRVKLFVHRRRR